MKRKETWGVREKDLTRWVCDVARTGTRKARLP